MTRAPVAVALLAGCTSTAITSPASCASASTLTAADLSEVRGCADLVLAAGTSDGTRLLRVTAQDRLQAAADAGGTKTWTVDLPDDTLTVELVGGTSLVDATCNDVILPDYSEDTTWTPTSGSASLTVTARPATGSEPWPYDGEATLDLPDGACFESPDAGPVWVEPISFSASVGWLPG